MLEKISKALSVVEELKKLPREERLWLLEETKQMARGYLDIYEQQFQNASPQQQLQIMQRIETLKLAERLLGTISIR